MDYNPSNPRWTTARKHSCPLCENLEFDYAWQLDGHLQKQHPRYMTQQYFKLLDSLDTLKACS